MDIKQINTALQNTRQSESPRKADNAVRSTRDGIQSDTSAAATERVSVTSASLQAQALHEKARDVKVDNREKVEALKQAIAEGRYEVDTQAVAKKLMQTEVLFSTL